MSRMQRFDWFTRRHRKHRASGDRQRHLRVEPMEDRRMLAVQAVNSNLDGSVDLYESVVTLRDAIAAEISNVAVSPGGPVGSGADAIEFNAAKRIVGAAEVSPNSTHLRALKRFPVVNYLVVGDRALNESNPIAAPDCKVNQREEGSRFDRAGLRSSVDREMPSLSNREFELAEMFAVARRFEYRLNQIRRTGGGCSRSFDFAWV